MSRPLKFRAWHQDYGMIHRDEYFLLEDAVDSMLDFFGGPSKDFKASAFTFMQFTGLHDKNGCEIYEGDIVQFFDGAQGVMVWDTLMDGWRLQVGTQFLLRSNDMLVIGNRYEHPDLLLHVEKENE